MVFWPGFPYILGHISSTSTNICGKAFAIPSENVKPSLPMMNCTICLIQLISHLERIVFKLLVCFNCLFWPLRSENWDRFRHLLSLYFSSPHVSYHHRWQIQFAASFSYSAFYLSPHTLKADKRQVVSIRIPEALVNFGGFVWYVYGSSLTNMIWFTCV